MFGKKDNDEEDGSHTHKMVQAMAVAAGVYVVREMMNVAFDKIKEQNKPAEEQ